MEPVEAAPTCDGWLKPPHNHDGWLAAIGQVGGTCNSGACAPTVGGGEQAKRSLYGSWPYCDGPTGALVVGAAVFLRFGGRRRGLWFCPYSWAVLEAGADWQRDGRDGGRLQ